MSIVQRLNYYRRLFPAYLGRRSSQLTFWHDDPQVNERCLWTALGEYYMPFAAKADYTGPYDHAGVPLLDYRGRIGRQYNPIAIAQFGLGNYNLSCRTREPQREKKWRAAADWLVTNLQPNAQGVWVWNHYFDWEYRTTLRAPWYSGLAQGQGISLLVRAHHATGAAEYLEAAQRALMAFFAKVEIGGVVFQDRAGNDWFEEYIVSPPTHILNGFIWASWGVYDYFLATGDRRAHRLFERAVQTLAANLEQFDVGFWSLYEQSGTRMKMLASPFYHQLHIVQLEVLYRLTGQEVFKRFAQRWQLYRCSRSRRAAALSYKIVFKLCYY